MSGLYMGLFSLDYYGSMIRKTCLTTCAMLLALAFASPITFAQSQAKVDSAESDRVRSNLTADLFYQVLVAEISAQQGDAPAAYSLTLDAARKSNAPELFERAVELALSARSGESALVAAQAWSRALPTSEDANRYVLQILVGLNRVQETPEVIKRHLGALPESARAAAIVLLPRYFARAADKRQASDTVEQTLEPELSNPAMGPAAWAAIGTLRYVSGDQEGALQAARRGAALRTNATEPVGLALALMESKGLPAEDIVRKYLASNASAEIRIAYIRRLLDVQRFADALQQAKVVTSSNPLSAEGWLLRGSLEYQEKQWDAAQTSLKKYVTVAKNSTATETATIQARGLTQAYLLLSQIAEQSQRLDEAQQYLDQIDSPQDMLRVQTRKAALMARQGHVNEALELLNSTPALQPEDIHLKIAAQAQLLRDFKRFQAAYDLLSDASHRFPDDVDLAYDLAMSAEKVGNAAEMEKILRQIIANKPDYHHAYNALGYYLADRAQRLPEAKQLIQKALEYSPNDPYIMDSLGWVEFRSGNLEDALRILRNAYQAKSDPEISAHLGEVLWSMQRKDEAMSAWKEGLKLSADNETLNETVRRLATP
jgi:tetratricopeptide (TPR) repeat protein